MKRIGIIVTAVLAALVPAVGGMWGNATFSRAVPVRVPSSAEVVTPAATPASSSTATPSVRTTTRQPGDDHGGARATSSTSGSRGTPTSATSSTSGGHGSDDATPEDHGSHGGHGSDDTTPDDHGGHGGDD